MWSSSFSFALRTERHWCLSFSVVAITLAALFALRLSSLPGLCALPIAAIACMQGWRSLRTGSAMSGITVDSAGRIRQEGRADSELQLQGRPWILAGVATGFQLSDRDRRITSFIVFRVQLSADTWRRLLVRLRRN